MNFPGRAFIREFEASAVLTCSTKHVADLCQEGVIKAERIGKGKSHWKIFIADWEAWLIEAMKVKPRKVKARSRREKTGSAAGQC